MTILIATVLVVFLVALVAVSAYAIGRNSMIEEDRTLTAVVDSISVATQDGGERQELPVTDLLWHLYMPTDFRVISSSGSVPM